MKRTANHLDGIRVRCLFLALLLFSIAAGTNHTPPARAALLPTQRPAPAQQTALPHFEAADCPFQEYEIPSDEHIDCGYLTVPEERDQAGSDTIQLAVAIIRTHNPVPASDPILYLEGGPGIGALDAVDYFVADAPGLRAERDIILLDQRGTGYSVPDLRCVEFNQLYASLRTENPTLEQQIALEVQTAARCRDRLLAEGVNLAAYNSAANAADVNDLRIALGYSLLNLYGFSYGSRLALTVMREYPQGVRSAVLDSALPLQAGWWEEQAANAERAYVTLFMGCANHPACHAAYPELENHFYALVDRLNTTPLVVEVPDAATAAPAAELFTGDDLVLGGFQALYDTTLIAYLPLAIEQIYAGNTDVIAGLAGQLAGDASISYSAMWFSVECQDEAPFNEWDKVLANAEAHPRFRNLVLGDATPAVCAIWGVEPSAVVETQAVHSDIPALVLAGEYDPIHPPRWSQLAASTLSQNFFYELAGISHGVGFEGCGQELVVTFIQTPSAAPDASCMAQLDGPPFVTDLYLNPGVYRLASGLLLDFDWVKTLPLLLCLLLLLSVLLIWPLVAIAAWRRRMAVSEAAPKVASTLGQWIGVLAFLAALLNVAFMIGLLIFIINTSMEQEYLLLFGLPSNAAPLFVIPWVGALLGIALLLLCVLAWDKHSGSMVARLYYTVVAVAVIGFVGILGAWGLLGLGVG